MTALNIIKDLDWLPGLIYLTDFETHAVKWANYQFLEYLDYSPADLNIDKDPHFYLDMIHPDDFIGLAAYQKFFLEEQGVIYFSKYRLKHKSGAYKWFQSSDAVLNRSSSGRPVMMIGVAVEIALDEQLNQKPVHPILTLREMEMVRLLAKGLSAQEISEKMEISTHTVQTHKQNCMRKLGVNNAAGVIDKVFRRNRKS